MNCLSSCANCSAPAKLKCSACLNAPEYEPGDAAGVAYCGPTCQGQHWNTHKSYCAPLKKRKKLLRTAVLAKTALLTYRRVNYDIDLVKIEMQGDTLYLHQKLHSITNQKRRGPFPDQLTPHVKYQEAALAVNQCTTAMAILGPLIRKLLSGFASPIEIIDLNVGRPVFQPKLVPGPDATNLPHTVLKLGRPYSKETWVLDVSGCQYGFHDSLLPYHRYIDDGMCWIVNEPQTYDASETSDLDFFEHLPFMTRSRAQRIDLATERRYRRCFADFVEGHVEQTILEGTDADFQNRKKQFAMDLAVRLSSLHVRGQSFNI